MCTFLKYFVTSVKEGVTQKDVNCLGVHNCKKFENRCTMGITRVGLKVQNDVLF